MNYFTYYNQSSILDILSDYIENNKYNTQNIIDH